MLDGSSDARLEVQSGAIASPWRLLHQSSGGSRQAWCRRSHFAVVASGGPCVQHTGRGRRCRRSFASLTQHATQITRENDRLVSHIALDFRASNVARLTWKGGVFGVFVNYVIKKAHVHPPFGFQVRRGFNSPGLRIPRALCAVSFTCSSRIVERDRSDN